LFFGASGVMIAYRREVLGSVEGGTRGTLDEAIRGLERKRKVHVMGGADPLIRLIRGAWDLYRGNPASGELVMFASWDELKAAAQGQKDGPPGDPALQVLVRLIKDRDRRVLQMCHQLEACVESQAAAQITVSTVHKAKGLEWPRVLMSSDFNKFVELEGDKPVIDLEEAYIMYVAVTRARKKLVISPACAEIISACAAARAAVSGSSLRVMPKAQKSCTGRGPIEAL
jgi:UvrD-like helicase C-terminal domain